MSFHHHHPHYHQSPPPPPPQSHCCGCGCGCGYGGGCCCSSSSSSCCVTSTCCCSPNSQIPSNSSDQQLLLQALAAHLLIQSQSQPQSKPQHRIFLKPPQSRTTANSNIPLCRHHSHKQQSRNEEEEEEEEEEPSPLLLIRSLIGRVSALESSLSNLSSSPPPTPQPPKHQKQPPPPPPPPCSRPHSIKHLAAATIQRHFRCFLARRSRTLRDLKHLASIKTHAAALKSSLAEKSLKTPRALSQKAMDLLFQLDSIQSSDPMIREGKRSISKELIRISEFVDKLLTREREDEVEELERRRDRVRRVSFAEDGDDAEVFDDLSERISEEEETQLRDRGFYDRFSDGEESPKATRHHDGVNGGCRGLKAGLRLAAPLPVKMEPRRSGSGFMKMVAIEED